MKKKSVDIVSKLSCSVPVNLCSFDLKVETNICCSLFTYDYII